METRWDRRWDLAPFDACLRPHKALKMGDLSPAGALKAAYRSYRDGGDDLRVHLNLTGRYYRVTSKLQGLNKPVCSVLDAGEKVDETQAQTSYPTELAALLNDLAKIRVDKTLADVTIVCDGAEYPVHKFILCARSDVFEAMLHTPMSEAKSGRIEILDVEAKVMEIFIR